MTAVEVLIRVRSEESFGVAGGYSYRTVSHWKSPKNCLKQDPPDSLGLEGLRAAVPEPCLFLGLPFIFTTARDCRDGQGR